MNYQDAKNCFDHPVKRFYLAAIMAVLTNAFKVSVSYIDGLTLKVEGPKDILVKCYEYFIRNFSPTMTGRNGVDESAPFFTVTRNMVYTVDGQTRSSKESTATVRDRQRMSSGSYRWNPTGALILKNTEKNCTPEKSWIVKSASGKILGHSRTLNAEAWGYVASFKKQ